MAEKKGIQKQPETPESGGSKKRIIIILASIILLIVLIGAGVSLFFFLKSEGEEDKKPSSVLEVPVPELQKNTNIGPMIDINDFIVNIISAETSHYVKASFTLELSNEIVKEEVVQRMPQVRDSILLSVGNKTYDELQDLQGKKQLKAELASKLNAILVSGRINSIYFTDFVVQ
ncbi:flagellar basal body-associated FliL family protein [Desulfopila inferna]|uniref:flagellar basal body-associated FliL family protein n=1 Tax=Desulfopila inferna TaxID=468528 RepID=UPI001965807E|nr:flagellar basal body-associated FliL family protein [Desulfopila inferna]MBM9602980.1 flagellar basal body-associated FliL family protein [Desulfopila inferna]